MIHKPEDRITLHPHSHRVSVRLGDTVVAETDRAIELREIGYPNRQYLPRDALINGSLQASDTTTYCPFKGFATYYHFVLDDRVIEDGVWSYEMPFDAMEAIAGRVVFDLTPFDEVVEADK